MLNSYLESYVPEHDDQGELQESPKGSLLYEAFSDEDLISLTAWLGERAFGCVPGPGCSPKMYVGIKFGYYRSMGYLLERTGKYQKALVAYRMYQKEIAQSGRNIDRVALLKRVMGTNNIPAVAAVVVMEDVCQDLKAGDVIYSYDGHDDISRDTIRDIIRDSSGRDYAPC